jgi:hypothetical protein
MASNVEGKNERGGQTVTERRRSGYRNGRNGAGDPVHAELRRICESCDSRIDGLEKFSDELRLGQVERHEQIRGLRFDIDAMTKEIKENKLQYQLDKSARELEIGTIRDKIDTFKVEFGDRLNQLRSDTTLALTNARTELTLSLDHGLRALDKKFDDNRQYFTRYFIIMLVTILTGLIVGGAAFILNR